MGSEIVRIKDALNLTEIRSFCTTDSPLSLHTVFPEDMDTHAGKQVQITAVSYYHMGFVLYELRQVGGSPINGHWPEDALEDQELSRVDENELYCLAADRYIAKPSDDGSLVEIRDNQSLLFCSMRVSNVTSAVEDVNRVAGLRCSSSFAARYNFEEYLPDNKT